MNRLNKALIGLSYSLPAYDMLELCEHSSFFAYKNTDMQFWTNYSVKPQLSCRDLTGCKDIYNYEEFVKHANVIKDFILKYLGSFNGKRLVEELNKFLLKSEYSLNTKTIEVAYMQTVLINEISDDKFVYDKLIELDKKYWAGTLSYCAFDISVYVLLCRFCLFLDLLDVETTINLISKSVDMVNKHYDDPFVFYALVQIGDRVVNDEDLPKYKDFAKASLIVDYKYGLWSKMGFNYKG